MKCLLYIRYYSNFRILFSLICASNFFGTWRRPCGLPSFVSIRPQSSAHSEDSCIIMMPFIVKSLCHPVVYLVETGDVDLVALVLVGQTSFITTLVWSLPISGDKLYWEAMMERGNCLSWLRDDDDDDECVINVKQESPAVADKPARRLRKVCTVYIRAVRL